MANSDSKRDELPAALRPGTAFGDYDIVRCIGIGGMGSVFEAVHRLMNRRVALKVLHTSIPTTADLDPRARFMREGAMLVRVQHPNVVAVYDAGAIGDQPYIAMELLEGKTFDRVVASQGRMSPKRAVDLVADAADGLEAAHVQGIVHRDVKPENLFVARDRRGVESAKLVDFGIAKDFRGGGSRNTAIGTPAYMSPEQLLGGHPVDGRCDQYALAVVLYEALTGTRPYDAPSLVELAIKLERGKAEPPSARGAPISAGLDAVVMRALAVDPNDRFGSMAAFATALRGSVTGVFLVDDEEPLRSTTPSDPPVGYAPTRAFRRSSVPSEPPTHAATERASLRSEALPGPSRGSDDSRPSHRRYASAAVAVIALVLLALAIRTMTAPRPTTTSPSHERGRHDAVDAASSRREPIAPAVVPAAPTIASPDRDGTPVDAATSRSPRPRLDSRAATPSRSNAPEPAPPSQAPTGLILER